MAGTIGVNEAFKVFKEKLDLPKLNPVNSKYEGFTARRGENEYFEVPPLEEYFNSDKNFGLVVTSVEQVYYRFGHLCYDPLCISSFIEKYDRDKFLSILRNYHRLLRLKEKKCEKDEHCDLNKRRALKIKVKVNELSKKINEYLNQKVQLTDNAVVKISSEINYDGWNVYDGYYNVDDGFNVQTRLSSTMPCKIDPKHPLVVGISNNHRFIEISIPPEKPSIIVKTKTERKVDPDYTIHVRRKVDKKALNDMIDLLLL